MIKIRGKKISTSIKNILPEKWFEGRVIRGKGRGKKLGFPTINLELVNANLFEKIKKGVYECEVKIGKKIYKGLLYWGPRLTFGEKEPTLEIYVLGWKGKTREGEKIFFRILKFLRKGRRFKRIIDFVGQMEIDIQKVIEHQVLKKERG